MGNNNNHAPVNITELGGYYEIEPFIFTGFNGKIPQIGSAEFWYDCHGCGNATAYRPVKCRKCNCESFDKRDPKGAARSFRYKRLRGVA